MSLTRIAASVGCFAESLQLESISSLLGVFLGSWDAAKRSRSLVAVTFQLTGSIETRRVEGEGPRENARRGTREVMLATTSEVRKSLVIMILGI